MAFVIRLAKTLGVSLEWLLFGTGEEPKPRCCQECQSPPPRK
ncbi:helix-turn-helix domain-containing protein [Candidatus Contendibacter odensensis]